MTLLLRAVCIAAILPASPALAQMPAAPMGTRASDTPHYKAAAAASERAVAICNGLWSGNQTVAQMDEHILTPGGDLKTNVDHEKRTVPVAYAESMPPRIAVWRQVASPLFFG